jgi:hypothetical protein
MRPDIDCPIFPADALPSHVLPSGAVKLNLNEPSQRADIWASQIEDEAQRLVNGLYLFWEPAFRRPAVVVVVVVVVSVAQ